jgi:hypothetical protein
VDQVTVGSRDVRLVLRCDERTSDGVARTLTAVVEGPGLSAERQVYEPEECGGYAALGAYFDEMALAWRGWDGPREWYSLEGELTLTAVHDGHVRMATHLASGYAEREWTLDADIVLDPGEELAGVAVAVRALIHGTG